MDQDDIERIAQQIFDANRRRETFRPLRGDDAPDSMAVAYRIQDRVHELFEQRGGAGPLGGRAPRTASLRDVKCPVLPRTLGSLERTRVKGL